MQDAFDLVVLLLDTGARYGEIANIEWTRINLAERSINLWRPKVQNGQFVFLNRKGGPRCYVSQAIRKALRKARLHDCRIHTLRHAHMHHA